MPSTPINIINGPLAGLTAIHTHSLDRGVCIHPVFRGVNMHLKSRGFMTWVFGVSGIELPGAKPGAVRNSKIGPSNETLELYQADGFGVGWLGGLGGSVAVWLCSWCG